MTDELNSYLEEFSKLTDKDKASLIDSSFLVNSIPALYWSSLDDDYDESKEALNEIAEKIFEATTKDDEGKPVEDLDLYMIHKDQFIRDIYSHLLQRENLQCWGNALEEMDVDEFLDKYNEEENEYCYSEFIEDFYNPYKNFLYPNGFSESSFDDSNITDVMKKELLEIAERIFNRFLNLDERKTVQNIDILKKHKKSFLYLLYMHLLQTYEEDFLDYLEDDAFDSFRSYLDFVCYCAFEVLDESVESRIRSFVESLIVDEALSKFDNNKDFENRREELIDIAFKDFFPAFQDTVYYGCPFNYCPWDITKDSLNELKTGKIEEVLNDPDAIDKIIDKLTAVLKGE